MDDIEEAEKNIHGDNLEGVKDDNAELHVARAVEARSCLPSIGFVGERGIKRKMEFLVDKG